MTCTIKTSQNTIHVATSRPPPADLESGGEELLEVGEVGGREQHGRVPVLRHVLEEREEELLLAQPLHLLVRRLRLVRTPRRRHQIQRLGLEGRERACHLGEAHPQHHQAHAHGQEAPGVHAWNIRT
jgi:hypothetical protein